MNGKINIFRSQYRVQMRMKEKYQRSYVRSIVDIKCEDELFISTDKENHV